MAARRLALSRGIAGRALFVSTQPRALDLSERRSLYNYLKQYGEIQYFRSLKYDYYPSVNGALVIYKELAGADGLLRAPGKHFQPQRIDDLPSPWATALQEATGLLEPIESPASTHGLPQPPPQSPIVSFETPPIDNRSSRSPVMRVTAEESATPIERHIEMDHFYGHFKASRTAGGVDLSSKVPVPGMAVIDWRHRKRPMREVNAEIAQDERSEKPRRPLQEYYQEWLDERLQSSRKLKTRDAW